MSSASFPSSKEQYDAIEGGLGGGLASIIFVILLLIFCIIRYHSEESLHTFLSVFYSSFTVRKPHTQTANLPTANPQAANKPVLLIWTRNVPTGCNGCLAYTYYCSMAVTACFWFTSFFADDTLYQKTTMCNDLDPNDTSHICFAVNESFKMVDCTAKQMKLVICYMFNPNIAGLGIGYSIATLCLSLTDVYYILLMKMTLKCPNITIASRLLLFFILELGGFTALRTSFQTIAKYNQYDYFGYGFVPMRVFQFALLLLTAFIATMLAPCKWNGGQSYYDIAS